MKTNKTQQNLTKTEGNIKNKGGRPKTKIDLDKVALLGNAGCTMSECAAYFKCSVNTIAAAVKSKYKIGFLEFLKQKDEQGRALLKIAQFTGAVTKDKPIMQIWLGKNRLGQLDKATDAPINPTEEIAITFSNPLNQPTDF